VLHITSNIDEVIAELTAAANEIESGLVPSVNKPTIYLDDLKDSAKRILDGLTEGDVEKAAVPVMVDGIIGFIASGDMVFELAASTSEENGGLSDIGPGDLGPDRLGDLKGDIASWVAAEKEKTARDKYKSTRYGHTPGEMHSVDKITARVMATLKHDPQAWLNPDHPDSGLLAYLRQKNPAALDKALGLTGLMPSRIQELVTAVLDFWQTRMGVAVVDVAMEQIDKALDAKRQAT
jgi:hypothetical protein